MLQPRPSEGNTAPQLAATAVHMARSASCAIEDVRMETHGSETTGEPEPSRPTTPRSEKAATVEEAADMLIAKMVGKRQSGGRTSTVKPDAVTKQRPDAVTRKKYPTMPKGEVVVTYKGATVTPKPHKGLFRVFVPKRLGLPKSFDNDRRWGQDKEATFRRCIDKIDELLDSCS